MMLYIPSTDRPCSLTAFAMASLASSASLAFWSAGALISFCS